MSNFDPSKLGQRVDRQPSPQGPKAERVFLVVSEYVTPAEGFHYAVGVRADKPEEQVRVRLNTVNERAADVPKENIEKIKAEYVSGENKRQSIADKAKAGIKFISFDDARLIGKENGVSEYRAHWSKTISTSPEAEVLSGVAHIKLKNPAPESGVKAQAYVELIKSQVIANEKNIDVAMKDALETKDGLNRARDPFLIMRAVHEGKVVANARVYPSFETDKVFDQNQGDYKDIPRKLDAAKTIENLMTGKPGSNNFSNQQLDTVRALVAGIKGLSLPVLNLSDKDANAKLEKEKIVNLYYGAKEGLIQIEVMAAEKIDFGPDSRKTYLFTKDKKPNNAYTEWQEISETRAKDIIARAVSNGVKTDKESLLAVCNLRKIDDKKQIGDNRWERGTPVYTQTVIGIHRHPDGEPYAVFASPKEMWPKPIKLADIPVNPVVEKEIVVDATKSSLSPEPEIIESDEEDSAYEP